MKQVDTENIVESGKNRDEWFTQSLFLSLIVAFLWRDHHIDFNRLWFPAPAQETKLEYMNQSFSVSKKQATQYCYSAKASTPGATSIHRNGSNKNAASELRRERG